MSDRSLDMKLIVAMARNCVIGNEGGMPWKIPKDMKRFRELTSGTNVIMGRKTYESIPERYRPLPGRTNIVLSKSYTTDEDILVFDDLNKVLDFVKGKESYVIGGESIYRQTLPYANVIEMTRLEREVEGDTYFPSIDSHEWTLSRLEYDEEQVDDILERFSFETYVRKRF
ncbi:MAG: dihydrofolate reductase [Candidatus Woesearchaeota archaeon]